MSVYKGVFKVISAFLLMAIMIVVGAYYHEIRHQQIFEFYKVDSVIGLTWLGFHTVPSNVALSAEDYDKMYLEQSECDNIKYNLASIEGFLALIFFVMALNYIEKTGG
jgi:hypothetical protein